MARIRCLTGPAAAIWLVIQTSTLVMVPAFFIAGSQAALVECTCAHDGNHGNCPMHHSSPIGARICIHATDSTGFAVLSSMLGHPGLVPGPLETLRVTPPPLAVDWDAPPHHRTLAPPKPPPPRA